MSDRRRRWEPWVPSELTWTPSNERFRVPLAGSPSGHPRWQLIGLAINDVVGSGIYLLPAAAAALLGAASIRAVMLAGVAAALLRGISGRGREQGLRGQAVKP